MTFSEFMKLVKLMKSIWTYDKFLPDEYSVKVWYELLKDIPFRVACNAVERYAQTEDKIPTPAGIRGQIAKMKTPEKDWSEAWGLVMQAVRKFGYINEKDAMEFLPEDARKIVKRFGWMEICTSDLDDLPNLRANFRKVYEHEQVIAKEDRMISEPLREKIATGFGWDEELQDRQQIERIKAEAKRIKMEMNDD